MKTYQGVLIAGLMAMSLAACSSTVSTTSSGNGTDTEATVGKADTAVATDHTNGSSGGGVDNSMGNNAGTGNSGVAPTGR